MDQLEFAPLYRVGSASPKKRERHTFDFVVNGISLFNATQAVRHDLCGSFSNPQFEHEVARRINGTMAATLTSDVPARGHRVALFVCPECGDLACGAVTVLVSRTELGVKWSNFMYENGFDFASKLDFIGPFEFDWTAYRTEIERSKID